VIPFNQIIASDDPLMEKYKLFIFLLLLTLLISSCNRNPSMDEVDSTPTINSGSPVATQTNIPIDSFLDPCDLINLSEMEIIFQESPLFISQEKGGCVIRNQWDTRSIWISVFEGEQALTAMQWHTQHLIEGWEDKDYQALVDEIINNQDNQSLTSLQTARLAVYEKMEYRWERYLTVGDSAFWIMNSWAFKGILDVVENETYLQIGFSGFLAAQVQSSIENLATAIIKQIPDQFVVNFDFPEENEIIRPTEISLLKVPIIVDVTKTLQEIYFGDLCGDEITTIRVQLDNFEMIENVYLVFRLTSSTETNDNWKTVFMTEVTPSIWEFPLNAEKSFLIYQLVNGAKIEYSIAVIYDINNVVRSSTYSDISLMQCRK
jgi:hypothetical protein